MVHGDDFVAVGDEQSTRKLQLSLENAYKVKCEVLGGDSGDKKEIRVLNRIIRRVDAGFTLEADPRHAELVIRDLGLIGARASKLPGSKEDHKRAGGGPPGAGVYPQNVEAEVSALSADSATRRDAQAIPPAPWYSQLSSAYFKIFMKGKGRGSPAIEPTPGAQPAPVLVKDGAAAEQVSSMEASSQVGVVLGEVLGD